LQFTKKGKIEVDRMLDEEEVIEAAINADVDDVEVCYHYYYSYPLLCSAAHTQLLQRN
jgi:transcriptional/translational regulatory protein YebC/TACO1